MRLGRAQGGTLIWIDRVHPFTLETLDPELEGSPDSAPLWLREDKGTTPLWDLPNPFDLSGGGSGGQNGDSRSGHPSPAIQDAAAPSASGFGNGPAAAAAVAPATALALGAAAGQAAPVMPVVRRDSAGVPIPYPRLPPPELAVAAAGPGLMGVDAFLPAAVPSTSAPGGVREGVWNAQAPVLGGTHFAVQAPKFMQMARPKVRQIGLLFDKTICVHKSVCQLHAVRLDSQRCLMPRKYVYRQERKLLSGWLVCMLCKGANIQRFEPSVC